MSSVLKHEAKSLDKRVGPKDTQKTWLGALSWLFLAAGVLLRLAQWLNNRSLWFDEAMLARNIIARNPFELLAPLDYAQAAPVLFLCLVKAATVLFGSGELALRFVPLCASIVGLVVFLLLAKQFLESRYVPIALFLITTSPILIYYSQELKQYSVDVAVTLSLTYSFFRLLKSDPPRKTHLIGLCVLGSVATFLSHPSVFILASIATTLIVMKCCKQLNISFGRLFLIMLPWVVGQGVNYILFLRPISANKALLAHWQDGFLPLPFNVVAVKTWYYTASRFLSFSGFPVHWHVYVWLLVAIALGYAIRRKSARLLMIAMCIVYALAASVLGKYPFWDRLILFAIPLLILYAVLGLQVVSREGPALVRSILALILVAPYLVWLPSTLIPIQHEEVKPLVAYLDLNRQSDDHVYVYYGAWPAVQYYYRNKQRDEAFWHCGRSSRDDRSVYLADMDTMRQWHRVWFLFAHGHLDEEDFFVSHMDGSLVEKHVEHGASLYLYDFSQSGANKAVASK
ncbi:MAG: glycosyltransferase family 39 protein [Kiritimatiellia bacterium]|jgi:hypothetical protein